MTAKPEFKVDIDNMLKARFADSLRDHYHRAMAREMIHSCPMLSYVAYKSEVLKNWDPMSNLVVSPQVSWRHPI